MRSSSRNRIHSVVEPLENRTLLSTVGFPGHISMAPSASVVAAKAVVKAATKTTLTASAGTLGQPVTFTVTVRATASAGAPTGSVTITDHGKAIQTITLSPAISSNSKYAISQATYTLTQTPGGSDYFFGKHTVSAAFIPSGSFARSSGSGAFTVSKPAYTSIGNGVEVATVTPGSGAAIQSGQSASVFYTGYLKSGKIFDDSINDGGSPFAFALGAGDVIPGFDAGTVGMQVGETRIVLIPPAQGYGNVKNGAIPANSTLVFVLTLESIS